MKSQVKKRSISIEGHKTSVSMEEAFWEALREIATEEGQTLSQVVAKIDEDRGDTNNLSSAIRLAVLAYYQNKHAEAEKKKHNSLAPRHNH